MALATGHQSSTFQADLLKMLPQLRAMAFSLISNRDRAEDLIQETILKAWKYQKRFQEGTNLRSWLYIIMRNIFISDCRRRRHEAEDPHGDRERVLSIAPEQHGYLDLVDLRRALDELPVDQREALMFVVAADLSYDETAKILGCPIGTVKSRVNRARLKLAQLLQDDDCLAPTMDQNVVAAAMTQVAQDAGVRLARPF
jgi:RNA polymerase sigma-70 factor (ECF subfamily)